MSSHLSSLSCAALLVVCFAVLDALHAQSVVMGLPATGPLSEVGDQDGDGLKDIGVGGVIIGSVSGAIIHQSPLIGAEENDLQVLGDINGDGRPELLRHQVNDTWDIWSPVTNQVFFVLPGEPVLVVADQSGDGVREIIFDQLPTPGPGYVVASGSNGVFLGTVPRTVYAEVADYDGDAQPDLLAGLPFSSTPVQVLSSSTGAVIRQFTTPFGAFAHVYTVIGPMGDVDGDSIPDVLSAIRPGFDSYVVTQSGATGAVIRGSGAVYGWSGRVRRISDLDGDGVDELLWYQYSIGNEAVCGIWSGRTFDPIAARESMTQSYTGLGHSMQVLGDLNGDGRDEFVLGGEGVQALLFRGEPLGTATNLAGATSPAFSLQVSVQRGALSLPCIDASWTFIGQSSGAGQMGVLMASASPFSAYPFPFTTVWVNPQDAFLLATFTSLIGDWWSVEVNVPDDPGLVGLAVVVQAAIQDAALPGGFGVTNGLSVQIGDKFE